MDKLISPEYKSLLQTMHTTQTQWARSGPRFLGRVVELINLHQPTTVLDYGCGKGAIAAELHKIYPSLPICLYDPCIEEFSQEPMACDFVICTDVLEHVEETVIEKVLANIAGLTKKAAYFVVHTGDCGHKLPDGRPAHILQREQPWWETKLIEAYGTLGFKLTFKATGLPKRFEAIVAR